MPLNLVLTLAPLLTAHTPGLPLPAAGAAVLQGIGGGVHGTLRFVVDVVGMTPDSGQLPGGAQLQKLMNGLQFWALALALVGLVVGAAAWALGSHGQNYQQSFVGRRAVLISGLAALLIGAGPGIVNFFYTAGTGVH
jgi:hypothetical protein